MACSQPRPYFLSTLPLPCPSPGHLALNAEPQPSTPPSAAVPPAPAHTLRQLPGSCPPRPQRPARPPLPLLYIPLREKGAVQKVHALCLTPVTSSAGAAARPGGGGRGARGSAWVRVGVGLGVSVLALKLGMGVGMGVRVLGGGWGRGGDGGGHCGVQRSREDDPVRLGGAVKGRAASAQLPQAPWGGGRPYRCTAPSGGSNSAPSSSCCCC